MIKAVRVVNPNGDTILMNLNGLEQGPFSLWSIEGLDQGEADIHVTELATMDGAIFNSSRQNSRELTLTMLLNWPNEANRGIQWAREQTYKYFPLKKKVKVIIYLDDYDNGGIKAFATEGYVKSNPVDIFAKQCAARVTILRTDTYFRPYKDNIEGYVKSKSGNFTVNILSQSQLLEAMGNESKLYFYYAGVWWLGNQSVTLADYGISVSGTLEAYMSNFTIAKRNVEPYSGDYVRNVAGFSNLSYYSLTDRIENKGDDTGIIIEIPISMDISLNNLGDLIMISNLGPYYPDTVENREIGQIYIWLNRLFLYPDFVTRGLLKAGDIIKIYSKQGEKDLRIYLSDELKEVSVLKLTDVSKLGSIPWPILNFGYNMYMASYRHKVAGVDVTESLSPISASAKVIYQEGYKGI